MDKQIYRIKFKTGYDEGYKAGMQEVVDFLAFGMDDFGFVSSNKKWHEWQNFLEKNGLK